MKYGTNTRLTSVACLFRVCNQQHQNPASWFAETERRNSVLHQSQSDFYDDWGRMRVVRKKHLQERHVVHILQ